MGREEDITVSYPGPEIYTFSRGDAQRSPQCRCSFTQQFPGCARPFTISGIINGSKPEIVTVLPWGGNSRQGWVLRKPFAPQQGREKERNTERTREMYVDPRTVPMDSSMERRARQDRRRFRGCDAPRRRSVRNSRIAAGYMRRPGSFRETTVEIEHPPVFLLGDLPNPHEGCNGAADGVKHAVLRQPSITSDHVYRSPYKKNIKRTLRAVHRFSQRAARSLVECNESDLMYRAPDSRVSEKFSASFSVTASRRAKA